MSTGNSSASEVDCDTDRGSNAMHYSDKIKEISSSNHSQSTEKSGDENVETSLRENTMVQESYQNLLGQMKGLPNMLATHADEYANNHYEHQIPQPNAFVPPQTWGSNQMTPVNCLPFPDGSGNIPPQHNTEHQQMYPPAYPLTGSGSQMALPQTMPTASSYPTVYVAAAGLITVLLKHDIAVELTLDKTIRVVNHRHKAVAATNARGNMNSVYHVAAKVFQEGTKTEAELFGERRARMKGGSGGDSMVFSSGLECYVLDEDHIVPSVYCFSDMSRDLSVNILFSTSSIASTEWDTEALMSRCDEVARNAKYYYHKNGSTTTIINNTKIHQDELGDVQVTSGPKYISTSPTHGNILIQTHFVDISVQINWCVRVRRGRQMLSANYTHFSVSNGKHEAGFDEYRTVFSRPYNAATTEFNNWIPSLALLPQIPIQPLPQGRSKTKGSAGGDGHSTHNEQVDHQGDYHKI